MRDAERTRENFNRLMKGEILSEEVCLELVKRNGYALSYIENQTEEICLEAVKSDVYALRFVRL